MKNKVAIISLLLTTGLVTACASSLSSKGLVQCEDYKLFDTRRFMANEVIGSGAVSAISPVPTSRSYLGHPDIYTLKYRLDYDIEAQLNGTACDHKGPAMVNIMGKSRPYMVDEGYADIELLSSRIGRDKGIQRMTVARGRACQSCAPLTIIDRFTITDIDTGQVLTILEGGVRAIKNNEAPLLANYTDGYQSEGHKINDFVFTNSSIKAKSLNWAKKFKKRPKRLQFDLVFRANKDFIMRYERVGKSPFREFHPRSHDITAWPDHLEAKLSVIENATSIGLHEFFYPRWNLFEE